MRASRYLILTEPSPHSNPRSPVAHQCLSMRPKDRQDLPIVLQFQLHRTEEPNQKQKTFLQNQGLNLSSTYFETRTAEDHIQKQNFDRFQMKEKINLRGDYCQKKDEGGTKKALLKKQSAKKYFKEKINTEEVSHDQKNVQFFEDKSVQRKSGRRKRCQIRSKEQYEQQCIKFLRKQQKQEVEDLFRHVNRQMKLSLKRNDGNNFYQKIRKNAVKKINQMSYNQKYFDNSQVQHLNSMVENCNTLIHKRDSKIETKPLYQTLKPRYLTEMKDRFIADSNRSIPLSSTAQKTRTNQQRFQNAETTNKKTVLEKLRQSQSLQNQDSTFFKYKRALESSRVKTEGLKEQTRVLSNQMNKIVNSCSQQQLNMRQIKEGMKIFGYYCSRLEQGFNSRSNKLSNFLKWEEIDK